MITSHSVLISIVRGVFFLSIFIGMCLPVEAQEGEEISFVSTSRTQSAAGTIPAEQAAVEQALGKQNLGDDFARFTLQRTMGGPTYAEYWYDKYKEKHRIGKNLVAIATPIIAGVFLSAAIAMCVIGDVYYDDWGAFGMMLLGCFVGVVGQVIAVATLTIGLVLLSKSKKKLNRLDHLLPSNSQYRTAPQISFRIGPQFAGLSVRF